MNLLLIESPGKIKKLKKILGQGWMIKASLGHIRQLAQDGEAQLGFDLNGSQVTCRFIPKDPKSRKIIKELQQSAKSAQQVYFASDPDREGELISWHLAQVLGIKSPQRVVYQEITEEAVRKAIARPRPLNWDLVNAGLARTCLDKLVGYKGSPLLWSMDIGAKSMGRVQSAALAIVAEREREILNFKPVDYWSVWCDYQEGFRAFYLGNEAKSSQGSENAAQTDVQESSRIFSEAEAQQLVAIAQQSSHQIVAVEGKDTYKSPPAPFTTSTLQQAAGSKLKFSPEKTMQVAQKLYEGGYITYMRTDSVALSDEFVESVRERLRKTDPDNLPDKVTRHRNKKNAQEAHEAIRPTDVNLSSAQLKGEIAPDEFDLYVLIWKRTVASLCNKARLRTTKITTRSGDIYWLCRGSVVLFQGYAKYWDNLSKDTELPPVKQGQTVQLKEAGYDQKQTQPPTRYTEPTLVQKMEKTGIGRPSTYAPTVKTLKQRDYVKLVKGKLHLTDLGMKTDDFVRKVFPDLVRAEFTAQMEGQLDAIASGELEWQSYLTGWNRDYFDPALTAGCQLLGIEKPVSREKLQREKSEVNCPDCGKPLSIIPSQSKKLAVAYFLKCESGCRDTVLFLDAQTKQWVKPGQKQSKKPENLKLTEFPCPVCQQPLAEIPYKKDGQDKVMLKCSQGTDKKHQDVAFFMTQKGQWWSKKWGELG